MTEFRNDNKSMFYWGNNSSGYTVAVSKFGSKTKATENQIKKIKEPKSGTEAVGQVGAKPTSTPSSAAAGGEKGANIGRGSSFTAMGQGGQQNNFNKISGPSSVYVLPKKSNKSNFTTGSPIIFPPTFFGNSSNNKNNNNTNSKINIGRVNQYLTSINYPHHIAFIGEVSDGSDATGTNDKPWSSLNKSFVLVMINNTSGSSSSKNSTVQPQMFVATEETCPNLQKILDDCQKKLNGNRIKANANAKAEAERAMKEAAEEQRKKNAATAVVSTIKVKAVTPGAPTPPPPPPRTGGGAATTRPPPGPPPSAGDGAASAASNNKSVKIKAVVNYLKNKPTNIIFNGEKWKFISESNKNVTLENANESETVFSLNNNTILNKLYKLIPVSQTKKEYPLANTIITIESAKYKICSASNTAINYTKGNETHQRCTKADKNLYKKLMNKWKEM